MNELTEKLLKVVAALIAFIIWVLYSDFMHVHVYLYLFGHEFEHGVNGVVYSLVVCLIIPMLLVAFISWLWDD